MQGGRVMQLSAGSRMPNLALLQRPACRAAG
jgi:hypothetical protein